MGSTIVIELHDVAVWCCHARCFVPEWYYDDGCFVGPCYNAAYAGTWGVPVCQAYYDNGSHFYGRYHNVANTVYANHSVKLAKRNASRLRQHGDWRNALAHDRLLHRSPTGYRALPTGIAAGAWNRVGNRAVGVHSPIAHAGMKQHSPNLQPRKLKPQASYASVTRSPKALHKAAKAHANHASYLYAHAAHPAARAQTRASRPQHTAHVQPQPQHAAEAHSGHTRHK